jgi:hypothetical protein
MHLANGVHYFIYLNSLKDVLVLTLYLPLDTQVLNLDHEIDNMR